MIRTIVIWITFNFFYCFLLLFSILSLSFVPLFPPSFLCLYHDNADLCLPSSKKHWRLSIKRKQSGNGSNILTVRRAIRSMHILCTNAVMVCVTLQSVRNYADVSVAGGREAIVSLLTDGLVGWAVQWRQYAKSARDIYPSATRSNVTIFLLS
jgi:hypothetical protein